MTDLEKKLGYTFRQPALLRMALTHPSMGLPDNQRLEFLGDAVLEFIMSDMLYRAYPESREGSLTHHRATLVCEAALHKIALSLNMGVALRMDRGEELTGGREKPSILADAVEAVLAAVYLDGGLEAARGMITRLWPNDLEMEEDVKDGKSALQEYLQGQGQPAPVYELIGQEGMPHERTFTVQVVVAGRAMAQAQGRTKKLAEQRAAGKALALLRTEGETSCG